jgi:hypothetical protein
MAYKAKVNLTVTSKDGEIKTFEKGVVYPDSAITKEIDESNFVEVSDAALEEQKDTEDAGDEGEAKPKKRSKKVAGEELE